MKKLFLIVSVLMCLVTLVGCSDKNQKSMNYREINITVPAGSEEVEFANEKIYFKDGRINISTDFETDVEVTFREENFNENTESVTVSAGTDAEITLEGEKWYEVGVKPDIDARILAVEQKYFSSHNVKDRSGLTADQINELSQLIQAEKDDIFHQETNVVLTLHDKSWEQ